MPETEEEQAKIMKTWQDWYGADRRSTEGREPVLARG
jgi:hypothetical protein